MESDHVQMACSPITYTCYQSSPCDDHFGAICGPGVDCYHSGWDWQCSSEEGSECSHTDHCHGLRCVDEECTVRVPCTTDANCLFDSDGVLVCLDGECAPYLEVRCESDEDCGTSGPARHCVTEIGHCARR